MPTIQLDKMHALIVYVSDLDNAKTFYAERLGFKFSANMGDGIVMTGGASCSSSKADIRRGLRFPRKKPTSLYVFA